MHRHLSYPFSLREKVPGGRTPRSKHSWGVRVRRSSDVQLQIFIPRPAVTTLLRRTLTPTPLPTGEGL